MKKLGFTMAEVLITLGIIGVVASVTLPSLMHNTSDAQIGPKLVKAMTSIEQANYALLNERGVDRISMAGVVGNYGNSLRDFMKITSYRENNQTWYRSQDGIAYNFIGIDNGVAPYTTASSRPHRQPMTTGGNLSTTVDKYGILIDINGTNNPNRLGADRFYFVLYNDGSLRPAGGADWLEGLATTAAGGALHWDTVCDSGAAVTQANAVYCAGSVLENDRKVIYTLQR